MGRKAKTTTTDRLKVSELPEEKPVIIPEEKPEEKPEETPEEKPEETPEEKPAEKPSDSFNELYEKSAKQKHRQFSQRLKNL